VVDKSQYKEFRQDGWPLCPNCGEDELWSRFIWCGDGTIIPKPTMDDYINDGLQCYRCQWESVEARRPYTIKVTGLDRLIDKLNNDT